MPSFDVKQIALKLATYFLEKPKEGKKLAEKLGLWDSLKAALLEELTICLARHDIDIFIEYVMRTPDGSYTKQAPFHKTWQQLLSTPDANTLIAAPRGHGKCCLGSTLITLADGSRAPVETLPLGQTFCCRSWTPELGFTEQNARVWQSTKQRCFNIRTKAGRSTSYSEEHPCWTQRGWVAACDLRPGDYMAVARGGSCGSVSYCTSKAWLLGMLIGGGAIKHNSIAITCADPRLREKLRIVAKTCDFNFSPTSAKRGDDGIAWYLGVKARNWLQKLELHGHGSWTKFIPAEVFTWNEEAVKALIAGYWAADGCINTKSKIIEFSSVSKQLLLDVQSLLLRLNIVSSLRVKNGQYKKEKHASFRLQINGSSIKTFAQIIGSDYDKAAKLQAILQQQKESNDNIDLIPEAIFNRLGIRRGTRSDKAKGCDLSNRRIRGQSRRKTLQHAAVHPNSVLVNEASLFWDEIIASEDIGQQQTFSVEVDETHVHITDDFVTHNSISLAARVLWELGRNHELRVKIVSSVDDSAIAILSVIHDSIERNERLHRVFPTLELDYDKGVQKDALYIKREIIQRDFTIKAYGVLSSAAGGRADILIMDDVVEYANAIKNPAMRVKVLDAVRRIWFPLKSNFARMWWVCTPYHAEDATHALRRDEAFDQEWWTPAEIFEPQFDAEGNPIYDDEGKPVYTKTVLWPEEWPQTKLDAKKREIGLLAYTQQYLLRVQSDEDLTFPLEALMPSFDSSLWRIGQAYPVETENGLIPSDWPTFGGIDLAAATNQRGAYSVIWTLALCPENDRLYLKEMIRKKVKFPPLLREIESAFDRHKWQFAIVENNAFQKAVETELDEKHKHIPIKGMATGMNKNELAIGLPGLAAAFSKGLFVIPARDIKIIAENDPSPFGIFWNELSNHPGARFSDTVMGLWFAYRAYLMSTAGIYEAYAAAACAG